MTVTNDRFDFPKPPILEVVDEGDTESITDSEYVLLVGERGNEPHLVK